VSTSSHKTIEDRLRDWTGIDRAMREGLRETMLRHKRLGQPIIVWRNGQVVEVAPEDIDVPASTDTDAVAKPDAPEAA